MDSMWIAIASFLIKLSFLHQQEKSEQVFKNLQNKKSFLK